MLITNQDFLHLELMEVVRMFLPEQKEQEQLSIEHKLIYEDDKFLNQISFNGKGYSFESEWHFTNDLEYKRYAKRSAKLAMYKVFSIELQRHLPWGALTGIRPLKMAYGEIELGKDFISLFREMDVCEDNIKLVEDTITSQKGIYKPDIRACDLFVSIPFCPSKCQYCSFITAPIQQTRQYISAYVDCLIKELENCKEYVENLKSIYVGGGTPLVLDVIHLRKILQAVDKFKPEGVEYTVEAGRPDVFTREKLDLLKEFGVNRLCINSQTFIDKTLVAIGRKHTVEDVYKAFEMCKGYGFKINCDLIAGLADESVEDFAYSVDAAIKLSPDNITVHTLCLKKGAVLKEQKGSLEDNDIDAMINLSRSKLYNAGYCPYYMYRQKYMAGNLENVGWCKKGSECVYNIDIMEEITNNIAVGANAVSKRVFYSESRIERYGTPKDLKTYIEKVDKIIIEKKQFFA